MTQIEIDAIERACTRLVHAYARHADFGEARAATELFVPEGVLEMPGGKRFAGHAALEKRLADMPASQVQRHVMSNVLIEAVHPEHAKGFAYVTLYRGTRGETPGPVAMQLPLMVGHYEDQFVCTPAGWRFASRKLTFDFRRAGE
jgi:hypothetical protein